MNIMWNIKKLYNNRQNYIDTIIKIKKTTEESNLSKAQGNYAG